MKVFELNNLTPWLLGKSFFCRVRLSSKNTTNRNLLVFWPKFCNIKILSLKFDRRKIQNVKFFIPYLALGVILKRFQKFLFIYIYLFLKAKVEVLAIASLSFHVFFKIKKKNRH